MAKLETGKWIVNYDNGLPLGVIDLKCPECLGGVICPKVDIPKWCGQCGTKLVGGGENEQTTD